MDDCRHNTRHQYLFAGYERMANTLVRLLQDGFQPVQTPDFHGQRHHDGVCWLPAGDEAKEFDLGAHAITSVGRRDGFRYISFHENIK